MRPRRFLLAVFGSRGNVFPLLAVGKALREREHHVTFATTERYREHVLAAGMEYHLLRPDPLPAGEGAAGNTAKGDTESGLRDIVFPRVEETYRDLLSAGKDAEIALFPMFIFPGPMAAERLGIPWVEVHFTPGTFNSIYDPPFLTPLPWLYPLQRFTSLVPRLFNPIARAAVRRWHAPLYELRAREGFSAEKSVPLLGGLRSPWLTLAMFSPLMGKAQKDWPKPSEIAGFPFYDEGTQRMDPDVETFLTTGEPPIVAALGSVASEDRGRFFEDTICAAERLDKRLVLLAGQDARSLRERNLPPSVCVAEYAPYSLLFPRACAIVISGSVGPISHALRAGRPMMIVAAQSKADQPDNALRVCRLGAARWTVLSKYDCELAVIELKELLGNPDYASKAAQVSRQVLTEDGITRACELLETYAKCWLRARSQ